MASERSALIVGAGIGGLAAGLALRRAGWQVAIHERATSPRELGFGLLLAPNALAALTELGIVDALFHKGVPTTAVEVRRLNGDVLRRFNVQLGGPSVVALRSDLHGALMQAVGADSLTLGSEASGFDADANGVTLRLKDGGTSRADILVAADGVNSVIRRQLHPEELQPQSSGYCAVRGVAFGVSEAFGNLSAIGYLDDGLEIGTARATRDAVYWYMSLLTRDIDTAGRTPEAIVQKLLHGCDATLAAILSATKSEDMRFDELFKREPLPSWGAGRVTLLGDAAHPVMPHTGQGAAQALEDAVALGLALSAHGPIEAALRKYEGVRSRRTERFIRLGPRIARATTTRSVLIQSLRTFAIRMLPERLLQQSAAAGRDPHAELRAPS
jgi:2-polyprenyl-6-methoxyphenol hydroxylase-like FAD-dependent oxidoreductase